MTVSGSYPYAMDRGGQSLGLKASHSRLNVSLCVGIILALSGMLWTLVYVVIAALLR